jgi:DNA-binding CsgD family transcriptional regulator
LSLTLSSSDLAQIETAITTLVSPLGFEDVTAWRKASRVAVQRAVSADRSTGMLPCAGEPLGESDPDLLPAITDYVSYYHTLDDGLQVRRRELGLEVCHWSAVYDMHDLVRTEIYNDFSHPNGLLDGTGLVYDIDPALPPAALLMYHERESSKPFGDRGLALLRLLMPAFKAGVETCLRLTAQRAMLGQLFDTMESALACFDGEGHLVQQNSAMTTLLGAEHERERLFAEMRGVAAAAGTSIRHAARHERHGAAAPAWCELKTRTGHYKVSASLLPPGFFALQPMIEVAVERVHARQRSDVELQATFRLTPREIDVARLLATRHGAAEIATTLGVSVHTARRHIEHVLMKLGVHSRGEVRRALHP